jgi:MFS superfamily sulfate permease-like transporter
MSNHWKDDIIAGFVVFLIALPLSIGIALAAGAPASAGILSAIIGGIIGTLITGTHITISGPAAGLIVVISGSILSLGGGDLLLGFKRTLAATIIAGILQVLVGVFRLGKLTFLAPSSVVHGMLAAIGTIIMLKQLPVILGVTPTSKSITGLIGEMPSLVSNADLPILFIGGLCFLLLVIWKYVPVKVGKIIPGPLLAVAVGLGLSYFMDVEHPHNVNWLERLFHIGPEFLVHVPESVKELFIFPQFDMAFTMKGLLSVMTIFIVGTLESLLSAYAVDKLDPYKRVSDLDYDIIGKGITNICCGALGAYPIITEIVRSSANITNGAKTKWANFFHGIFILGFVALLPDFINHIPLSALAAILILVGYNLAHPRHFVEVWHHGKDQFVIFTTTLVVTLVEDLLVGIVAGIVIKLILHFIRGVKPNELFSPKVVVEKTDGEITLKLNSNAVFLGYLTIKKAIVGIDKTSEVKINTNGYFIDFTIKELLKDSFIIKK